MIKDSGNRREFSSGAVRDIQEGKGRCDLLPLDVIAKYTHDDVLYWIAEFQESHDTQDLGNAIEVFQHMENGGCEQKAANCKHVA